MASREGLITESDWVRGHVDMRCLDCGATAAGSGWCYRCSSTNVELRTHAQTPVGDIMWCTGAPKQDGARLAAARASDS